MCPGILRRRGRGGNVMNLVLSSTLVAFSLIIPGESFAHPPAMPSLNERPPAHQLEPADPTAPARGDPAGNGNQSIGRGTTPNYHARSGESSDYGGAPVGSSASGSSFPSHN